mmetsp:Transcript_1501/g.2403  ORF Transcript_1501/g.2403 Transcript_1501/m.2403 type:complete len:86 (+) Transcript_1501:124-381(+)
MPESTDGAVRGWNEVNIYGEVVGSSVYTVAVCGRNRVLYFPEKILFEQYFGAAGWGRYFTNGVWQAIRRRALHATWFFKLLESTH